MEYGSTVLFVDDFAEVVDFYGRAFGCETKFIDQEFGFAILNAGGADLGIATHDAGEQMMPNTYWRLGRGNPRGVEISFTTEEVQTAYDRAVEAGASSMAGPAETPWGQVVAYVQSIEGTIVGFCTPIETPG